MAQYKTYRKDVHSVRTGVRDGFYIEDVALTTLGFKGTEDVDWENMSSVVYGWAAYWAARLDTWNVGFGYDTYVPDEISVNDLTNIQWYAQSDILIENVYLNYVLAFQKGYVLLSDDNGVTYKYKNKWEGKERIEMSRIFTGGSVVWATCNAIFNSQDFLVTINQSSVLNALGNPYIVPFELGNNYEELILSDRSETAGIYHVFGNYGNVSDPATPTNYYYTIDKGLTYKICYTFGVYAGLGDPANPLTVRHNHVINYNPSDNTFWGQTGDGLVAEVLDCRWMKGEYNISTDTWTWAQVASGTSQSIYKSAGIGIFGNDVYVGSDATGDNSKWNVLKGLYVNMATGEGFSRIYTGATVISSMTFYRDGVFIGGMSVSNKVIVTKNYGVNFTDDTITNALFPVGRSFFRFSEKRNDGWLKANYTGSDISFRMTNALWIKIK